MRGKYSCSCFKIDQTDQMTDWLNDHDEDGYVIYDMFNINREICIIMALDAGIKPKLKEVKDDNISS